MAAYSEDLVKAKLSALNETQDSIASTGQWLVFHRRHAERGAQLLLQRLHEVNPSKRLNLIYLANEVMQQAKARKRDEWLQALSPIIADATTAAYKSATNEIQQKIRRVVEVWRTRAILEGSIQADLEARIEEADKSRPKRAPLGGSLFANSSASVPPELQAIVSLQTEVSRASVAFLPAMSTSVSDYDALIANHEHVLQPPVLAARLEKLLKNLDAASTAANESVKARESLIGELDKLAKTNRDSLKIDEDKIGDLREKRRVVETRKREVEDGIVRGLSAEDAADVEPMQVRHSGNTNGSIEIVRPETEPLTPPPMESFTPPDALAAQPTSYPGQITPLQSTDLPPAVDTESHTPTEDPPEHILEPHNDLPGPMSPVKSPLGKDARARALSDEHTDVGYASVKRRKTSHTNHELDPFITGDALEGLDEDVVGKLGAED